MAAGIVLTIFVLVEVGFNPSELFTRAAEPTTRRGDAFLQPGLQFDSSLALLSFGIAFVFGTAGLPHILMRFFTVPDAKAARGSVGWAVFLIGAFYLMVMIVGVGARAILGQDGEEAAGSDGNLAIPSWRRDLGGGEGSDRRRDLPRHHLGRRARDDPRRRRRPRDLGLRRGRPRPVVQRRPQGPRLREARRSGSRSSRRSAIGVLAIAARDRRRRGLQRLRARRHGVLLRRERELPGAAARAVVAALQHRRARWSACSAGSSPRPC